MARVTEEELLGAMERANHNPVIDGLMKSISGLVAVLNSARQIVSVNDVGLCELGISDAGAVLGLRLGEMIHCVHATEGPGGCGTTAWCASCGAAIAVVSAVDHDDPEERICAATLERNGHQEDRCFRVQAIPLHFKEERFVLLFMQDITDQQSREEVGAVFYHDLSNSLTGLMGVSDLLAAELSDNKDVRSVQTLIRLICRDVGLYRMCCFAEDAQYQPVFEQVRLGDLLEELRLNLERSDIAGGKMFEIKSGGSDVTVMADRSLLRRILLNMLTNAFEASAAGEMVRFWVEQEVDCDVCCVWNPAVIPSEVQLRIFQRHFSTKPGEGRGLGTFAMRLFAENVSGGRISFTSSAEKGTLFRLALPRRH
jgi:signal transduction histidine kinase